MFTVTVAVSVAGAGTSSAASPCDAIVQRGNALQRLFQAFTEQAYSDGVITSAELAASDVYYQAISKTTADLGTCIQTGVVPPGYLSTPLARAKHTSTTKRPAKKLSPKARAKGRKAAIKHTYGLAKQARALASKGRSAQTSYAKTKSGKTEKSFGDWLVGIKTFFDKKQQLQDQLKKFFGKQEPRKVDLSKFEAPAAGFRKAQLLQLPQFTKQLETLGDFRNVAIRAALSAEQRDPEIRKQLDLSAGLYKGDYNATFDSLTPQERGDVATQASVMIQTGAAGRLVEEMNAAGRSATNVVFAH